MKIEEQRAAFLAIGTELVVIAEASPLDWKRASKLHHDLGEALITEAHKQKRQRYLDKRAERRLRRSQIQDEPTQSDDAVGLSDEPALTDNAR